jgi:hypothetical protein
MVMLDNQSFADAYKATRIIETLENYTVADQIVKFQFDSMPIHGQIVQDENEFWRVVLSDPNRLFDTVVSLSDFTLSEWVPRVPGLIHLPGNIPNSEKFLTWLNYPTYESATLLRGVGTNLLLPENGHRICSICKEPNVSAGIPVLITNSIWQKCSLEPNLLVSMEQVRWQRMAQNWSQRFESVRGLPRGYLVVEDESQISVSGGQDRPVIYQPYSLIEYFSDNVLLYDYLIREVDATKSWEMISDEFEDRRKKHYPEGRFLLNPDPSNPFFNAAYDSPEHLRRLESGGQFHLELVKERIRTTYYSGNRLQDILRVLSVTYSNLQKIDRLATYLRFPISTFISSRPADRIAQLIHWSINTTGRMEELIDKIIVEQPDLLYA